MKDDSYKAALARRGEQKLATCSVFSPNGNEKGVVSLGILQGTRKLIKLIIHGY
jgi:hypothetical protein